MEETIVDRTVVKKGWDRTRRGRTEGDRKESMRDEGRKGKGTLGGRNGIKEKKEKVLH